jgi:hypothetical protein
MLSEGFKQVIHVASDYKSPFIATDAAKRAAELQGVRQHVCQGRLVLHGPDDCTDQGEKARVTSGFPRLPAASRYSVEIQK